MLNFRTLGSLNLLDGEGEEASGVLAQPKRYALLVFLAVSGGFHRRDTLLSLFWPELPENRARNALSQSLSFLRRLLPPGLLISRGVEEVGLAPKEVRLDTARFQRAVENGLWAEALDLYGGEFLRGFHVSGAPAFEEWVQSERDQMRDAAARSGWALAREQIFRGALVEAERAARRALNLVCPDEGTIRAFMSAIAGAGDRVAALRIFEQYSVRLREDLGLVPGDGLEDLAKDLREGEGTFSGPEAPLPEVPPSTLMPFLTKGALRPETEELKFFGREKELRRLEALLARALAGHGSAAFLTGEAGTGKTRLAQGFTLRAISEHQEVVVATGSCDAHTGLGDPYHPFREILRLLTGDVEAQWMAGSITADHAQRLWGLLPTTTEALLDSGPELLDTIVRSDRLAARASAHGPRGEECASRLTGFFKRRGPGLETTKRAALFDQYSCVVRKVAQVRPLILVLEDLQWADAASLELLFQLGRHLEGTRVLLLGLYRPSEVALGRGGDRHPLEKVLNEFQSVFGDLRVNLDEGDGRAFIDAMVDFEPNTLGDDFREALFERTLGHALFANELFRGLKARGGLVEDETGHWAVDSELDWNLLPARIEAVIEERTSRLPGPLRRILTIASVEGEDFTLEAIARVLGKEPHELLPLVSGELEKRHRLVRLHGVQRLRGQRISVYRFRHILFQQFLYARLDAAERAYLHEQVGRALEGVYGEENRSKALSLARHFQEAGLTQEAVVYFRTAAAWAVNAVAFPEGMALYKEALRLIRSLPASSHRDMEELRTVSRLCTMEWTMGILDSNSENNLFRLKELAGTVGDDDSLFWACCCEMEKHHFVGEEEKATKALDEAEAIALRSGNPSQRVQVLGFRGLTSLNSGHPSKTVECLGEFEALYDPARDEQFLAQWLQEPLPVFRALKALALGPLGYPESAVRCMEEAHALLDSGMDPAAQVCVWGWDLLLQWLLRDVDAACRVGEPFEKLAEGMGPNGWLSLSKFSKGWCEAEKGEPLKGVAKMEEAVEEMDGFGWVVWRPFVNSLMAGPLGGAGRTEDALQLLDWGLDRIQRTGERGREPEVNRVKGETLLSLSCPDTAAAEAAFRQAIAIARKQETKLFELRATVSLTRLLGNQGREKEARKDLQMCYDWFTEGFEFPDLKEAEALLDELG